MPGTRGSTAEHQAFLPAAAGARHGWVLLHCCSLADLINPAQCVCSCPGGVAGVGDTAGAAAAAVACALLSPPKRGLGKAVPQRLLRLPAALAGGVCTPKRHRADRHLSARCCRAGTSARSVSSAGSVGGSCCTAAALEEGLAAALAGPLHVSCATAGASAAPNRQLPSSWGAVSTNSRRTLHCTADSKSDVNSFSEARMPCAASASA